MHPDSVSFGRVPFPAQHPGPLGRRVAGVRAASRPGIVLRGLSGASCAVVSCQQPPGSRKREGVLIISFSTPTSHPPHTGRGQRSPHQWPSGGLADSWGLARLPCCVARPGHGPSEPRTCSLRPIKHFLSASCMPDAVLRVLGIRRRISYYPCLGSWRGAKRCRLRVIK